MPRKPGKISKPMQLATASMRLTPDEKAKLDQLKDECGVTLSWAMYQGALMYLEDLKAAIDRGESDLTRFGIE